MRNAAAQPDFGFIPSFAQFFSRVTGAGSEARGPKKASPQFGERNADWAGVMAAGLKNWLPDTGGPRDFASSRCAVAGAVLRSAVAPSIAVVVS
jgi:hypothetical protein